MPTEQTTPSPAPPSITKVWVVEKDSYTYNDNYVIAAELPRHFYLSEDAAKLNAGYLNMQFLLECWGWFYPPVGSNLRTALDDDDWDFGDEAPTGNYAVKQPSLLLDKVYGMSMDEACMFFADQGNIEALLNEVECSFDEEIELYVVCELTLGDN